MLSTAIDLTGQTFARLTVLKRSGGTHDQKATWLCRCQCGNDVTVIGKNLRNGNTKSCGCLRNHRSRERATKHSRYGTREYISWGAAKTRCFNRKQTCWANYGGRGITMCVEWVASFEAFYRDMGPCPPGHSIDRINVNGNYEPSNCRWVPNAVQAANTRANHVLTWDGMTLTITEWERVVGFKPGTLKRRLQRGWTVERATTEPIRRDRRYGSEECSEQHQRGGDTLPGRA